MKRAGLIMLIFGWILLSVAMAAGTDTFGVPVYSGGTYDVQTTKAVNEMMKLDAACYRTKDSVSKVVDFCKKTEWVKAHACGRDWCHVQERKDRYNATNPMDGHENGQDEQRHAHLFCY